MHSSAGVQEMNKKISTLYTKCPVLLSITLSEFSLWELRSWIDLGKFLDKSFGKWTFPMCYPKFRNQLDLGNKFYRYQLPFTLKLENEYIFGYQDIG